MTLARPGIPGRNSIRIHVGNVLPLLEGRLRRPVPALARRRSHGAALLDERAGDLGAVVRPRANEADRRRPQAGEGELGLSEALRRLRAEFNAWQATQPVIAVEQPEAAPDAASSAARLEAALTGLYGERLGRLAARGRQ